MVIYIRHRKGDKECTTILLKLASPQAFLDYLGKTIKLSAAVAFSLLIDACKNRRGLPMSIFDI